MASTVQRIDYMHPQESFSSFDKNWILVAADIGASLLCFDRTSSLVMVEVHILDAKKVT